MKRSNQWFGCYSVVAMLMLCGASHPMSDSFHGVLSMESRVHAQDKKKSVAQTSTLPKPGTKSVLMVIPPKNFRDEELFETKKIIEAAGYRVIIASTSKKQARGMLGAVAVPDISFDQVEVSTYTAVVFVGGSGTKKLLNDPKALTIAKTFEREGKLVAAICMAPEILANANLLKGKRATVWRGGQANLSAKGAILSLKNVEQDGRIITGNGPSAAKAFGRAIVKYLSKL